MATSAARSLTCLLLAACLVGVVVSRTPIRFQDMFMRHNSRSLKTGLEVQTGAGQAKPKVWKEVKVPRTLKQVCKMMTEGHTEFTTKQGFTYKSKSSKLPVACTSSAQTVKSTMVYSDNKDKAKTSTVEWQCDKVPNKAEAACKATVVCADSPTDEVCLVVEHACTGPYSCGCAEDAGDGPHPCSDKSSKHCRQWCWCFKGFVREGDTDVESANQICEEVEYPVDFTPRPDFCPREECGRCAPDVQGNISADCQPQP